jgi:hypothetical protein
VRDRSAPPGLFAEFGHRCRGIGLTDPADQLAAFLRLPGEAQDAAWRDLAGRIDRERRDAGLVA